MRGRRTATTHGAGVGLVAWWSDTRPSRSAAPTGLEVFCFLTQRFAG